MRELYIKFRTWLNGGLIPLSVLDKDLLECPMKYTQCRSFGDVVILTRELDMIDTQGFFENEFLNTLCEPHLVHNSEYGVIVKRKENELGHDTKMRMLKKVGLEEDITVFGVLTMPFYNNMYERGIQNGSHTLLDYIEKANELLVKDNKLDELVILTNGTIFHKKKLRG